MELRGQKKDIGLPMGYSALSSANQESSSKLSSGCLSTGIRDGRRNPGQTLDHHLLHQQLNPQPQQQIRVPEEEDSNPNLNPDPDPSPLPTATITIASNSKSTPAPPPPQSAAAAETTSAAATSAASIRYRECLKNHAASMGGHVVDGCGEFMPNGEEGTPEALKCAACDCHRSFHRKEVDGDSQPAAASYYPYNPIRNNRSATHLAPWLPPPPPQYHRYSRGGGLSASPPAGPVPPLMVAFGGGGAHAESSSEDLNMFHSHAGTQAMGQQPAFSPSKKRFRTKFTPEQKDKMQELAERLGWKIQKEDEEEVQRFCAESGVKRRVFKMKPK
ncbi:zinc-finger homeodomain protein 6 isoform X2 [Diospyros lotus]|uniref:zinc-finger homeodomain protein 6 isoform X2 n=1 Tax=Diospyros lotus TaxID=55363 RepID=UPI0022520E71|nr:zinc-finger homeodomain protein 6 isoform X2 [Diospyros lotus]